MQLFGVNTPEFLILVVLAMLLIGPDKLPEYIGKLRDWIAQARGMADGARSQLKEQMGPEFEDINWRQYDPRQYDPRAIVRQALFDEPKPDDGTGDDADTGPMPPDEHGNSESDPYAEPVGHLTRFDPDRATPWDLDAT